MSRSLKVLFVCHHGAAKSVIAAEYLRRLAGAGGWDVEVTSAGLEPDERIPPHVIQGLGADGFDVSHRTPQALTHAAVAGSDFVVSFACDLETGRTSSPVIRWDDVPAVSDGYELARDAIVAHVESLLRELPSTRA